MLPGSTPDGEELPILSSNAVLDVGSCPQPRFKPFRNVRYAHSVMLPNTNLNSIDQFSPSTISSSSHLPSLTLIRICSPAREFISIIDDGYKILLGKMKDIKGAKVENQKFGALP
ncbi:hypothetical protein YC2023_037581 [Brassica napus]